VPGLDYCRRIASTLYPRFMGKRLLYLNLIEGSSSMTCRKCGADALRRENRRGFMQYKVFPLFGLYPWECMMCREVLLYQKHFPEPEVMVPCPVRSTGRLGREGAYTGPMESYPAPGSARHGRF
jgi:hypothetical protein